MNKFKIPTFFNISLFLMTVFSSFSLAQTLIPELPESPYNYASPDLPDHFLDRDVTRADTTPPSNPITNAGATLGRVLFYDKKLSLNNTISCASCHRQEHGFSDPDRFSTGFLGGVTPRHSMSLANTRYYDPNRFFWDERSSSLEAQVIEPIQDPIEMGMDLQTLQTKLSNSSYYDTLFTDAFGSPEINTIRISQALAQFVRSIVSYRSKYDVGVSINFSNFTAQEEQGRQLFNSNQTRCDNCHEGDLQILDDVSNNGLDATTIDPGAGNGQFKSPSLRNIAIRPPYMHDGRFSTLAEVISFYNSDIQNHPNLDNQLQRNGQPRRMNLDNTEQAALVAFLETLTDTALLQDEAFADPFIEVTNALIIGPIQLLLDEDERE